MISLRRLSCLAPFALLVALATAPACSAADDAAGTSVSSATARTEVAAVLEEARAQAIAAEIKDDAGTRWNMPSYLGHHYVSEWILMTRWLGISTAVDTDRFRDALLKEQMREGSWEAVHDATLPTGDLSATVLNYAALKVLGVDTTSAQMELARKWIRAQGGADHVNVLTKFVLAMFGVFRWADVTPLGWKIPSTLGTEGQFAQWTGPHIRAMAYLRAREVRKDLGPSFRIDELFLGDAPRPDDSAQPALDDDAYGFFLDFIGRGDSPDRGRLDNGPRPTDPRGRFHARQQPGGSWGAYTVSTLLTMAALDDYRAYAKTNPRATYANENLSEAAGRALVKGADYIESLYLQDANDPSPYKGPLMDGHVWDTALLASGIIEAGASPEQFKPVLDYLRSQQVAGLGGFPFGKDFYYAPDTDDTAEAALALLGAGSEYRANIDQGMKWVEFMQNDDGGWAGFSRNNTGTPVTRLLMSFAADSVDPFDLSCADVTGHILEAFGRLGRKVGDPLIDRALEYLRNTQAGGSWQGRWGVNRVYATAAAVVGLAAVGVPRTDPMIASAIAWLESRQNADGGFGESIHSYEKPAFEGRGISTPTQTAWALLAFMETGDYASAKVQHSVDYLVTTFRRHGRWVDNSSVGTGHPKIIYMHYPSYALAFPMTALGRYMKHWQTPATPPATPR